MLEEIKNRHEEIILKMCCAEKVSEQELLLAHMDRDELLKIIEKLQKEIEELEENKCVHCEGC